MGRKSPLWAQIARIAAGQHGNITADQLLKLDMGKRAMYYAVATGRLFRVHHGVYSVGHPAVEPLEKAAAAVLACGPRAALSHGSAMTLWGFWKRWDEPFEVVVAGDRRPARIRTHRCVTLLQRDVRLRERIRVTSPARALLDMAPKIPAKSLSRFVNDGRLGRILTLADLADVAVRNRTHAGARLLMAHAQTTQNATRSRGEDDFAEFCARYGLPLPVINTTLHGYEVDVFFPREKLIVELDGWPFHRTRDKFEGDREQDATMLMYGIATIRITYDRIEADPAREARRLHRILEDRRRQLHG